MLAAGMTLEKRREYKANEKLALAADPVRASRRAVSDARAKLAYKDRVTPNRRPRAANCLTDAEKWASFMLSAVKSRSRKRGLPLCNLTVADLLPLSAACPVLGVPFVFKDGLRGGRSPSVDRIIPALGYVRGNIAVISTRANILKRDCVTGAELIKVAAYIDSVLR